MTRAEQDLVDTKRAVREHYTRNPHLARAARERARSKRYDDRIAPGLEAFPHAGLWAGRWVLVVVFAFLGLCMMVACAGCGSLQADYVDADRATYSAVAPVYSAYTTADKTLSPEAKERRYRLLRSWAARLEEAAESGAVWRTTDGAQCMPPRERRLRRGGE